MAALGKKAKAESLVAEGPPFPDQLQYLWARFLQISTGLASGGMGFPKITWEGLDAWCRLMKVSLEPWEAETLLNLSVLQANIHAENKPKPAQT